MKHHYLTLFICIFLSIAGCFAQTSPEDVGYSVNNKSSVAAMPYVPCPSLSATSTITSQYYCNGLNGTNAATFQASGGNPAYSYSYFNNINQSVNQSSCALPGFGSVYSSAGVRGLWFVCPTNTVLTGVRVPTDVGTANQFVYIVKLAATPPEFPASTTAYTVLGKYLDVPGTGIIDCGIPLSTGDIIGVLGTRGSTATTNSSSSYATPTGTFVCTIGSATTTMSRFIFQSNTATTPLGAVSSASNGAIGREELYFGSSASNTNPATSLVVGNYSCYYTDADGCMNTGTFVITPPATLTAVTSVTNTVCNQGAMMAAVTPSAGFGNYTYNWSPSGGNAAVTGSLTAGTYSCLITDASGNCLTSTVSVQNTIVTPTLNATASSSLICAGSSVTLSATGSATNFAWNGSPGATYTDTPTTTTNYTVQTGSAPCTNSAIVTVAVSLCTGIENDPLQNHSLLVYPNPAGNLLYLESSAIAHIELVNILGSVIYTGNAEAGTNKIDLSNYSKGIYYLKISEPAGERIIKVIKD